MWWQNIVLPSGLLSILLANPSTAFYFPGVSPTSYKADSIVPLNVNRLAPSHHADFQLQSTLAFDYYYPAFHFCQPKGGPKDVGPESLGAVLFGDRIKNSPYELRMLKNESCKRVPDCEEQRFRPMDAKFVNMRIWQSYSVNWLIDGLPAATSYTESKGGPEFYSRGFPLGEHYDTKPPSLNNHHDIYINYHDDGAGGYRVVGVLVRPSSRTNNKIIDEDSAECGTEDPDHRLSLAEEGETSVTWTYSVEWRLSPVAWATRWDTYIRVKDPPIHWFSLVNSAVIVVFLSGTVSAILMRALKKDFARYNRLDTFNLDDFSTTSAVAEDGVQEDSGWKLVHGDVFRPPKNPLLLSVFLGNGTQLFFMTGITILFALLGFLSPSWRGSIGSTMILLYTIFGFIGGYTSARVYKTFGGDAWKQNIAITPVFIPAIVFGTFFLLNLFLWARGASGAVPFTTMLVIVGIWFLISVPLSFLGSWIGFKQPAIQPPVKTNQIPRQIPPSTHYLRPIPSMLLVGALPFGAIFVELYFIMRSLWFDKVYYMFGFLFVSYGITILTCASVTVMFVYYLLCAENYHWQWRAFTSAGASAGFVFANALLFWIMRIRFSGFTSLVVFLGYSGLISFLFFVLTGTIGFFASWAFVHRIYGSIRID